MSKDLLLIDDRIQQVEAYARHMLDCPTCPDLLIAHGFDHVDRVRHWALRIAAAERWADLDLVQAAALLHDIGLASAKVAQRDQHGPIGSAMADTFLREHQLFTDKEITEIVDAIRFHNAAHGGGRLAEILRDADKLDALGAVGLMRAFTSHYAKPPYERSRVMGDTWQLTLDAFERRFARGQGIGRHIIDHVNFQTSLYDGLYTEAAQEIARPLADFMKLYVRQLDSEVNWRDP
jgi:uncharacterized protein